MKTTKKTGKNNTAHRKAASRPEVKERIKELDTSWKKWAAEKRTERLKGPY
jgi:hypothetical protein